MRRVIQGVVVVVVCALTLVGLASVRTSAQGPDDESRVKQGFAIAPVPLHLQGRNRALVGLGSYLVNATGVCADCHSCPTYAPGHFPFDGAGDGQLNPDNYLAGGVAFGPFVSANLTPDDEGRPAGLTLAEFKSAIRTGHDPENAANILQVMPWPFFRHLTDHDLEAIYAFLSTIPPAEPGTCGGPGE